MPNIERPVSNDSALWTKDPYWVSRPFIYGRAFLLHLLLFCLSYYITFVIRAESVVLPLEGFQFFAKTLWVVVGLKLMVVCATRTYCNLGHYATLREFRMMLIDAFVSYAFLMLVFWFAERMNLLDLTSGQRHSMLTILVVDMILTVCLRGGARVLRRFFTESITPRVDSDNDGEPAFLVGANSRGAWFASIVNAQSDTGYRIVGFLTIHDYKVHMRVGAIPVVAKIDHLVEAARKHNVKTILFIAGSLPGSVFRQILTSCNSNGLNLQILPQLDNLSSPRLPVRNIDVKDLLKRDPIVIDVAHLKTHISNRCVLVTGAGGSVGSEICRKLLLYGPKTLVLLGRGENRISYLGQELRTFGRTTEIVPLLGDVTDPNRIDEIFKTYRPEIVFHTAAHKNAELMETNLSEALRNNVYGTKVVAEASAHYGVERFLLTSTNRVVNPTSALGCSKLLAERCVIAMNEKSQTRFSVIRFGNLLGSNGSVVPLFMKQIQNGGPITLTDRRMTRCFMTIPEAALFSLESIYLMEGGETFVLDLGAPVKIEDLAKDMIRLAGLPENSIEIKEIGLRPGEKLSDSVYSDPETRTPTIHKRLFVANRNPVSFDDVQRQVDELMKISTEEPKRLGEKLKEFIPEFAPND